MSTWERETIDTTEGREQEKVEKEKN